MASAEDEVLTIKWTKVLISGPPETGKSSSIKLLLGEVPNPLHDSTPIIKPVQAVVQSSDETGTRFTRIESIIDHIQSKISTSSNESDEQHFICITDTGGQAAFLDIAPAFLRGKSAVVNIVTQKLTKGLKDETEFFYSVQGKRIGDPVKRKLTNEQVLDWLISSIVSMESRGPNEESYEIVCDSSKPSVFVFGTFYDQSVNFEEKKEHLNEYLDKFDRDVTIQNFCSGNRVFPLIANKSSSEQKNPNTFEKIIHKICKSYTKAKISRNQLQLLKGIQDSCKEKNETTIPVEECYKIGKKHNMKPDDVQKTLLFFHDLSGISYFTALPNVVFLKPQDLVDDISLLISISFFEGSDYIEDTLKIDMPNDALENMQHGYFETKVINKIARFCKPSDLLTLMIELHITAKFERDKYFLPCVLLTAGEKEISTLRKSYRDKVEPLIVSWDNKVIPRGLFCTLITFLLKDDRIKLVELNKRGKPTNIYRNAIQLVYKPSGGILLIDSVTYIEIYYNGQQANCYEIKEFIFDCLTIIIKELHGSHNYLKLQMQFFCIDKKCEHPSVHLCVLSERDHKTLTCPYGNVTTSEVTTRQRPWLGDKVHMHVYLHEQPPLHELCANIEAMEPGKIQSLANQLNISGDYNRLDGVFEAWLKECSKPTRLQVIEALRAIGEKEAVNDYVNKIEERTFQDNITNSKKLDVDTILFALKKIGFDMKTTFDLAEKLDLSQDWYDENEEKYEDEPFENILKEFMSHWLHGEGKSPKTYGTLRDALTTLTNRYDALIEETFSAMGIGSDETQKQVNDYTSVKNLLLDKAPQKSHLLRLFNHSSSHYSTIGTALDVQVDDLLHSQQAASDKLILVFQRWIDSNNDVTWRRILQVCEDFPDQLGKAKAEVERFLSSPSALSLTDAQPDDNNVSKPQPSTPNALSLTDAQSHDNNISKSRPSTETHCSYVKVIFIASLLLLFIAIIISFFLSKLINFEL
ncbi:PREDICTED: uncharacterized protein LOC109585100 isoform X1 [Amphimedon queenslandica]|uniref:Death domain-containing protein n=1 Tax=Amphimedon queenslandica TaxID=400682 RepID=A0AAN0JIK4_AMPQE|nr:PREDICTED: uncharacterized protein LOC109585100 isoform X1 [Amphimedon queenslandica]|eukprot:XP_019856602.1 PREDICTED: uncharacterized protein LOC109585100 isoform X1 [Amphimedon queenslandica]